MEPLLSSANASRRTSHNDGESTRKNTLSKMDIMLSIAQRFPEEKDRERLAKFFREQGDQFRRVSVQSRQDISNQSDSDKKPSAMSGNVGSDSSLESSSLDFKGSKPVNEIHPSSKLSADISLCTPDSSLELKPSSAGSEESPKTPREVHSERQTPKPRNGARKKSNSSSTSKSPRSVLDLFRSPRRKSEKKQPETLSRTDIMLSIAQKFPDEDDRERIAAFLMAQKEAYFKIQNGLDEEDDEASPRPPSDASWQDASSLNSSSQPSERTSISSQVSNATPHTAATTQSRAHRLAPANRKAGQSSMRRRSTTDLATMRAKQKNKDNHQVTADASCKSRSSNNSKSRSSSVTPRRSKTPTARRPLTKARAHSLAAPRVAVRRQPSNDSQSDNSTPKPLTKMDIMLSISKRLPDEEQRRRVAEFLQSQQRALDNVGSPRPMFPHSLVDHDEKKSDETLPSNKIASVPVETVKAEKETSKLAKSNTSTAVARAINTNEEKDARPTIVGTQVRVAKIIPAATKPKEEDPQPRPGKNSIIVSFFGNDKSTKAAKPASHRGSLRSVDSDHDGALPVVPARRRVVRPPTSMCAFCCTEFASTNKATAPCNSGRHVFCQSCMREYIQAFIHNPNDPNQQLVLDPESLSFALPCLVSPCHDHDIHQSNPGFLSHKVVRDVLPESEWIQYQERMLSALSRRHTHTS